MTAILLDKPEVAELVVPTIEPVFFGDTPGHIETGEWVTDFYRHLAMNTGVFKAVGLPRVDIQVFSPQMGAATGSGQGGRWGWRKPSGAAFVKMIALAAGGGGGSGRKGVSGSSVKGGGGGGASGAYSEATYLAVDLPNELYIRVGAGGQGGPAQVTGSADGNAGSVGTNDSMVIDNPTNTDQFFVLAIHGDGGFGGTATGAAGGVGNAGGAWPSIAGAASSATGLVGIAGTVGAFMASGGSGGGISTGAATSAGGNGALPGYLGGTSGLGTPQGGVAGGTSGGNGDNGFQPGGQHLPLLPEHGAIRSPVGGASGAGGGSTTSTGQGGNGGSAGLGSGGGGGGAAVNTSTQSGTGGRGGDGIIVIISW